MTGLLKKNMSYFVMYVAIIYPVLNLSWILRGDSFAFVGLLYNGFPIILIVMGAVSLQEMNEIKSNGYAFLKTLPLNTREIVNAKFLTVFVVVLFLTLLNFLLHSLVFQNTDYYVFANAVSVSAALISLLASALIYVAFFRFSGRVILIFLWIFVFLCAAMVVLGTEAVLVKMDQQDIVQFVSGIGGMTWVLLSAFALIAFWGLNRLAVFTLNRRNFY